MEQKYYQDRWTIKREQIAEEPEYYMTKVTSVTNPEQQYNFRTSLVNGLPCLKWCPQSRFDKLNAAVTYRDSDIFVATYPKCGTTWSEQCVLLLTNGADPSKLNPVHKNTYNKELKFGKIWPEAQLLQDIFPDETGEGANLTLEEYNSAPEPRVLKTHMPINLLPGTNGQGIANLPPKTKIIVVSRNPLDACVSSYYHAFNPAKSGWPFEAWATTWINGYAQFGDYFDWMKGWYAEYQKYPDRILWVQYEDMKKNPFEETLKMARYLGVSTDSEFIQRVVQFSSFDSMVKSVNEKGGDTLGHLRKGEIGDWKNHFTPELYELFRQHTEKEFMGTPFTLEG